jgi:membrane protease YdiL (CAAX protease family)
VRAFREGRLFPPQRFPAVPWGGIEVIGVLFLVYMFWPLLVYQGLQGAGFFTLLYGPAPSAADTTPEAEGIAPGGGEPKDAAAEQEDGARSLRRAREELWVAVLAFPFQVASVVGLLSLASGTRPWQLGLTTDRFGRNVLLGFLGWLVLAPLTFSLNVAVILIYYWLTEVKAEEHPLTHLLRTTPASHEAVLVLLGAACTAPVLEELIFRGLLLRWFASRRWGGMVALTMAFALALVQRWPKMATGWQLSKLAGAGREAWALVFVLVMVPGYWLVCRVAGTLARRRWQGHSFDLPAEWPPREDTSAIQAPPLEPTSVTGAQPPLAASVAPAVWDANTQSLPMARAAGAIYATSLLFAAAHSFAWPSPVSLFVLALGLGYLAYRTQSLVAPIVLHALFNGTSCALILLLPHLMD